MDFPFHVQPCQFDQKILKQKSFFGEEKESYLYDPFGIWLAYFFRCPRNWVRYIQSCYKFTRSPIKRWDDARLQCQAYRHQDSDNSGMKLTIKFHTIYPVTYGSPISGSKKCRIINSNKFEFGIVYGGIFAKNLLLHYAKSVI